MSIAARPPAEDTDEDLVRQVLSGDQGAFELLYARYLKRVFHFIDKRMANRADVEEVTQEVFINVFSSLESFRAEAPFAAWVLGIARYSIAARFKKRQHATIPLQMDAEGDFEGEALDNGARSATPHEVYELNERIANLVSAAERKLSAEQRRLFELHHLEHQSIAEIARTLHKSPDAIKSNLYRARRTLLAR